MDLTRVLESPHALHAASVHLPMSLAILGLPLILIAVLAPRRWPGMRLSAAAYFFFTGLIALAASITGQRAAAELVALANKEIETVVAHHRILGFSIVALPLVTAVLLLGSHFRAGAGGRIAGGLAALNALALAAVVLFAGSSGGRLVYGYGIGTPVADGASGATVVVGAYRGPAIAAFPAVATAVSEPANANYTPKIQLIDPAQAALVTFQADVAPLLERRCFECHSGVKPKAGLDLSTHAGILQGGDYAGPSVIPGDPDGSPMVRHLRGIYLPKMPKDAEELTEGELHTIRMWIAAGAQPG
ncbi:MAG: hypothetical protein HYV26_23645 [Candidatus Hydrogenedentes bacterium]|nr:hypothetical protein [Candidatus Hydrogenedentota bacterium]